MTIQNDVPVVPDEPVQKKAFDQRLDSIGWGLFFLLIGILWLLPDDVLPESKWMLGMAVGVGVILLGQNVIRYLAGIKPRGGAVILGVLALAYGLSGFYGMDFPFFPVLFILIGAAIILFPRGASWRCGGD